MKLLIQNGYKIAPKDIDHPPKRKENEKCSWHNMSNKFKGHFSKLFLAVEYTKTALKKESSL